MKKCFFLTLLLVMLLLCSTALACVNPNGKCSATGYYIQYIDDVQHKCTCLNTACRYSIIENHYIGDKGIPATCISGIICGGCKREYGAKELSNHQPQIDLAVAPTCT